MRSAEEVALVLSCHEAGLNQCEISRATGIPRETLRQWLHDGRTPAMVDRDSVACSEGECRRIDDADPEQYSYLLGLYLGDGCISTYRNGVFRLRISCCNKYPELMRLCADAMRSVLPNKICYVRRTGCTEVTACSNHWPCLFPQHGPGRKHERPIILADWQKAIIAEHPKQLLRGLIHSDGCRSYNWVGGRSYSRYMFTNASDDIRGIFCAVCDQLGIEWRRMNARNISVARRSSVEFMDTFIGPKT